MSNADTIRDAAVLAVRYGSFARTVERITGEAAAYFREVAGRAATAVEREALSEVVRAEVGSVN